MRKDPILLLMAFHSNPLWFQKLTAWGLQNRKIGTGRWIFRKKKKNYKIPVFTGYNKLKEKSAAVDGYIPLFTFTILNKILCLQWRKSCVWRPWILTCVKGLRRLFVWLIYIAALEIKLYRMHFCLTFSSLNLLEGQKYWKLEDQVWTPWNQAASVPSLGRFEKWLLFWIALSPSVLGRKLFPATSPQHMLRTNEK